MWEFPLIAARQSAAKVSQYRHTLLSMFSMEMGTFRSSLNFRFRLPTGNVLPSRARKTPVQLGRSGKTTIAIGLALACCSLVARVLRTKLTGGDHIVIGAD